MQTRRGLVSGRRTTGWFERWNSRPGVLTFKYSDIHNHPAHLRRFLWTEESRLDTVIDGGGNNATKFLYDAHIPIHRN